MAKSTSDYILSIKEIKSITEAVKDKYGFDFTNYAFSSLQRRLSRILSIFKFKNVDELIQKIVSDKEFYNLFLEEITVNTTEMFRDPEMWKLFKEKIIKKIAHKKFINIWHAGCSSGEEVFSMAILLKEAGLYDKTNLVATDINSTVIQRAKSGIYSMRNMEVNQANYERFGGTKSLSEYYTREDNKAIMDSSLLSNVTFRVHNLAMHEPFAKFDIILCRNVLIYFDKTLQEKVFKLFNDSLIRQGFLILGAKESMVWSSMNSKFNLISDKEKIYQQY